MTQLDEIVKKGLFKGLFSPTKKYACNKGELILTAKNLLVKCEGSWLRVFPIWKLIVEVYDKKLELRDHWYRRLLFKLIVDKPEEWEQAFQEVSFQWMKKEFRKIEESAKNGPREIRELLDINPEALKRLYNDTRRERQQFQIKNIRFNMDIQSLAREIRNRKLEAFIVAHSYVAWYEWTKGLLYKIHKARLGKGPKDDNELMKFLEDYPSLKSYIDTTELWGIQANQIRNCVSHERFYFDYRHSELVFMMKKEKRVRLPELSWQIRSMTSFYDMLLRSLVEKVTKGEITMSNSDIL